MPRLKHRLLAGTSVLLAVAAMSTFAPASSAEAGAGRPGTAGLGDYIYPNLGNGGYDARDYALKLRYPTTVPTEQVQGTVTMNAVATHDLSSLNLDFNGEAVTSVRVNGQPATYDWQQHAEELVITPVSALRRGCSFSVQVTFASRPVAPEPGNPYPVGWVATEHGSFTSPQPHLAHGIIPLNDHPSDKARWRFELDVPRGVFAVANGEATGQRNRAGRTVFTYDQRTPMATELMQLAVGTDLHHTARGIVANVNYRDVIAKGREDVLEPGFANGPSKLEWAVDQVGRFPHRTYGNLGVDQRMGYALETQGLSLHSYCLFDPNCIPGRTGHEWFYGSIMVHEVAHEWYGNSVSPRMWSDLWLNEGWATWMMKRWESDTGAIDEWGHPTFEAFMKDTYSQGDIWRAAYGPVARPLNADVLFSPNVYDGGALVLYALQQKVGAEKFEKIQREWPKRYRDKSVGTDEFIAFANEMSGQDLTEFLTSWLYGDRTPQMPGHPEWTIDPAGAATTAAETHASVHPSAHAWGHTHAAAGAK
jgi:aminopeptidase N